MDCVVAATKLKNLLVAHGNAEAQVSVLGKFLLCSYIVLVNVQLIGNIISFTIFLFLLFWNSKSVTFLKCEIFN